MNRPRARELGIDIGIFNQGSHNAITDVPGVAVGSATLIEGEGPLVPGKGPVRTGVTVVLPHGGNLFREKVQAGCFVLNGFGKSAGLHQIRELGTIETPIALTNTLNVSAVADALVERSCAASPEIGIGTGTVNPVVGDINDGYLNDIQGRHVKKEHVFAALAAAKGGPVAEGNVGGGTGCSCLGFKGGIGGSSRVLPARLGGWTVGVLAQTNFGGMLTVNGAPVGRELGVYDFAPPTKVAPPAAPRSETVIAGDGSCMIVIATDAPLDARLLTRVARRAGLGMARTGFYSSNGSGDFFIAFSTANRLPHLGSARLDGARLHERTVVADDDMSAIFAATVEAVEESVINSLLAAETMTGRDGNLRRALDPGELVTILDKYNARGWAKKLPPFGNPD
ncbi:MAG: P1 family peptidase [Spirochaetales bacterium]